ncbi:DUF4160 domain-containing protein [Candidatus Bipolaricaulota bacterium]|nr:DUF4160 domain-containing protein [Candidatus Bipolaricaulota bacterium]
MPTVVEEGEYKFIIHTNELPYEPPHVHVRFNGDEVRVNLDSGRFMETPSGGKKSEIMKIYKEHLVEIRKEWDRLHHEEQ